MLCLPFKRLSGLLLRQLGFITIMISLRWQFFQGISGPFCSGPLMNTINSGGLVLHGPIPQGGQLLLGVLGQGGVDLLEQIGIALA